MPGTWSIGPTGAYYGTKDSMVDDYGVIYAPGVDRTGPTTGRTKMVSSNLVVLMRKPGK